jgi:carbon-monoxide dehydrogenase medium subunit
MIPNGFEYHSPSSLDEAIKLLAENEDSKIIAGGHSLLPMMKLRFSEPAHLIDMKRIEELRGIREQNDLIKIGAMTTENNLIASPIIRKKCALISDVAKLIGDPQVRNLGTIGGDVVHGDPGNDHPAVMMALDANFVVRGPDGERNIAANEFFLGTYWTELKEHEILVEIQVSALATGTGYGFNKLKRKAGDFATAASVVVLELSGDVCTSIRIALTNVGPMSIRAKQAEEILTGQEITESSINKAMLKVMEACDPAVDLRGNEEYKRHMAGEMTRRSIRDALVRARG